MKVLLWLLLAAAAPQPAPHLDANQNAEPKQPSLELLQYLGQFETIDGDWIDPTSVNLTPVDSMSFDEQYDSETKAQDDETDQDAISKPDSDPDAARLH